MTKKIIISVVILGALALASYYFVFKNLNYGEDYQNYSDKGNEEMNMGTTTNNESPSTSQIQSKEKNASIAIENFAFNSSNLTVTKGTTITWVNYDSAPHTVTSDTGTMLNSKPIQKGESFEFTFNQSGTFTYHCAIHPMMKGSITVN
jgi:plastocyanin